MALDFPDSPTNGDEYNGFIWDNTFGVWRLRGGTPGAPASSNTPTVSGGYNYVGFTSDGTFTVTSAGTFQFVLVGGGGAGGKMSSGAAGGGGGAGGALYLEKYLEVGAYPVVIGAGGLATAGKGNDGEDTTFAGFIASGGGGGSSFTAAPGAGGSGGGGNRDSNAGGTGTFFQGYPGGNGNGSYTGGAGGGGAGGFGSNAPATTGGGSGGVGSIWFTDFGTALSLGVSSGLYRYFAGGGGGGASAGGAGTGGTGGGGAGAVDGGTAGNGTVNTGGGGGGAEFGTAGNGGSGVMMIRWAA